MVRLAVELLLPPALIGTSWRLARRFGERIGGIVSAFPAIVGPFLLLAAERHGTRFAANAASGTLGGLLAFSGFILVYARTAARARWWGSLAAGWSAAAALAFTVDALTPGPPAALALAIASLLFARQMLPAEEASARPTPASRRSEVLLCMALSGLLVCLLTLTARLLGATVAGVIASLPAVATVLALNTHRLHGRNALYTLLRGMLDGMTGFVLFCEVIVLLAVPAGIPIAFASATLGALTTQTALFYLTAQRPRSGCWARIYSAACSAGSIPTSRRR
jgi:hypothetical protein